MQPSEVHYFPLTVPYFFLLGVMVTLLVAVIELHMLAYAYDKMGVRKRYVCLVLVLSLLGSCINIPVAKLPAEEVETNDVVSFFGVDYVVPVVTRWPGTIVAINLGAAVIPLVLSFYLGIHRLLWNALLGIAIVSLVTHALAHPVRGIGIAIPTFVPPIVAALVRLLLSTDHRPDLAYISGSLGTLIGADLWNLGVIRGLGAPVVSIGDAGTFDGIFFLTGMLAVLLTGSRRQSVIINQNDVHP